MILHDINKGEITVTKAFREYYSEQFSELGYDLNIPFSNSTDFFLVLIQVWSIDYPESADALARQMGIIV